MVVELSSRLIRRCRLLRQPLRHLDELARDLEKLGNEFIILFGHGVRVMLSLLAERFGLGDRCLQCNNLGFELPDPFGRSLGLPLSLLVQGFTVGDGCHQRSDTDFRVLDRRFGLLLQPSAQGFGLGDRCLPRSDVGFQSPDTPDCNLGFILPLLAQCFGFSDRSLQSDDLCFQALDWSFILGGPLRIAVCTETSLENLGEIRMRSFSQCHWLRRGSNENRQRVPVVTASIPSCPLIVASRLTINLTTKTQKAEDRLQCCRLEPVVTTRSDEFMSRCPQSF